MSVESLTHPQARIGNDAVPSCLPPVFSAYTDDATGTRIAVDEVVAAYVATGLTASMIDSREIQKIGQASPLIALWLAGEEGCGLPFDSLTAGGLSTGGLIDYPSLDFEAAQDVRFTAMEWAVEKYGRKYLEGFRGGWTNPHVERRRLEETKDRSWCRRVDEGSEDGWRAAFEMMLEKSEETISNERETTMNVSAEVEVLPDERMNSTDLVVASPSMVPAKSDLIESPIIIDHVEKIARMLAYGAFTPAHLVVPNSPERTIATCFRIAAQAYRWKVDPFALADDTYECRGKLGYGGKIVASIINTRAGLKGRLKYDFHGEGDGRTVTVTGQFKTETEPRTITLSVGQAKREKNDMWKIDPDQKLCYSGALKWARRHCPELVTGVLTVEDLEIIEGAPLPPPPLSDAEIAEQRRKATEAQRAAVMGAGQQSAQPPVTSTPASQAPAASGNGQPTNGSPAPANPSPLFTPISKDTREAIGNVIKHAGWEKDDSKWRPLVRAASGGTKEKISQLSQAEGDRLLIELLTITKGPSTPASQSAANSQPTVTPPAAPTADPSNHFVPHAFDNLNRNHSTIRIPEQKDRLKELRTASQWPSDGPDGFDARLRAAKSSIVNQLSEFDAETICWEAEGRLIALLEAGYADPEWVKNWKPLAEEVAARRAGVGAGK